MNEVLFREVNERLRERGAADAGDGRIDIYCECASAECTERIELTEGEYEQAHAAPDQFVVVPGHEVVAVEEVVLRTERFEVVRKQGEAGEVARLLDPS